MQRKTIKNAFCGKAAFSLPEEHLRDAEQLSLAVRNTLNHVKVTTTALANGVVDSL